MYSSVFQVGGRKEVTPSSTTKHQVILILTEPPRDKKQKVQENIAWVLTFNTMVLKFIIRDLMGEQGRKEKRRQVAGERRMSKWLPLYFPLHFPYLTTPPLIPTHTSKAGSDKKGNEDESSSQVFYWPHHSFECMSWEFLFCMSGVLRRIVASNLHHLYPGSLEETHFFLFSLTRFSFDSSFLAIRKLKYRSQRKA